MNWFGFGNLARFISIIVFIISYNHDIFAQSCVTGFVRDPNGNPVVAADLDFDDAITGRRLYTPGDNTDANGFYTVCVPNGIYNISYAPPRFTHLLGYQIFDETLINAFPQIDVTLNFGRVISGTVSDSAGSPIGMVDLDADDLSTGARIYTPNDNSDSLTGDYWIVVPQGQYRIRFQPAEGTRWLGLQLNSVPAQSDTVIDAVLAQGMLLSGHVTNTLGQGLRNITVDLRHAGTGEKVFLSYNRTDSTGFHDFAVPTGLFTLRYEPPLGSRYVGVAIDSFAISGDTNRDQVLESGWLISTFVHDSTGNPIHNADLDIIQESTGLKLFTPNDKTDSLGATIISLLSDTYTFRVNPPPGSIYDRLVLNGVNISADTSMDFTLAEVPKVNVTGRVINMAGDGLADISIDFSDTLAGSSIFVADNTTDSLGNFDIFAPIGSFRVDAVPARGSRYVGSSLGPILIENDTTWSDIVLSEGWILSAHVFDPQGLPVEKVDFDFIDESTGNTIFTPHDNTDIDGAVEITIPGGIYTVSLDPPVTTSLEGQLIPEFNLTSDTTITFFLARIGATVPVSFILKDNAPNPFNGTTSISYILFNPLRTSIIIYNNLGQRVKVIDRGIQAPGFYVATWDGTDSRGKSVASGLYFYRLETSMGSDTRKMLLVR